MSGWPDESRAAFSTDAHEGDRPLPAPLPTDTSRYAEGRLVGAGGMGRVEAVRDAVLEREVARKTLTGAVDGLRAARMMREARLTARLDHPGIVPVHDAGSDPDGRPWYTMRLIRGRSLSEATREARTPAERLALVPRVVAACQAVAYAHAVGIIHRDLKPSNVMVGPFGETQVVDWGLARWADEPDDGALGASSADSGSRDELTTFGSIVGTPKWMAPEQARGEAADRRSDVYALGRTLQDVLGTHGVPRDLQAIVARATAPQPDDRYPDAGALAQDLEDWLAGRRVSSYAYSTTELLGRLVRAWRVPITVGLVALVLLVGGLSAAWRRAASERDRAVAAEDALEGRVADSLVESAQRLLAEGDLWAAEEGARKALELRERPDARGILAALAAARPHPRPVQELRLAGCDSLEFGPGGDAVVCSGGGHLSWVDLDPPRVRWTVDAPSGRPDITHDGQHATLAADARLYRWAAADGDPVLPVFNNVGAHGLAPTPAGLAVVVANSGLFHMFDAEGQTASWGCPQQPDALVMLPLDDGRWVIPCAEGALRYGRGLEVVEDLPLRSGGERMAGVSAADWLDTGVLLLGTLDGRLVRLDLEARETSAVLELGLRQIRTVARSPDGALVAVAGEGGVARVLDTATLQVVASLPFERGRVVWSGPRELRAVDGDRVWTWALDGVPRAPDRLFEAGMSAVDWSPDGLMIATGDGHGRVRLLSAWRLALLGERVWDDGVVKDLAFTPDGGSLWLGSAQPGALRRVTLPGLAELEGSPAVKVRRLAALADGGALVVSWSSAVFTAGNGAALQRVEAGTPIQVDADARGRRLLLQAEEVGTYVIDPETGPLLLSRRPPTSRAAISRDGARAAVREEGEEVVVYDAGDGRELGRFVAPEELTALALDGTGALVFGGTNGGKVWAWAAVGGALRMEAQVHSDRVGAFAVSPDNQELVSVGWDGRLRLLSLAPVRAGRGEVAAGPLPVVDVRELVVHGEP